MSNAEAGREMKISFDFMSSLARNPEYGSPLRVINYANSTLSHSSPFSLRKLMYSASYSGGGIAFEFGSVCLKPLACLNHLPYE